MTRIATEKRLSVCDQRVSALIRDNLELANRLAWGFIRRWRITMPSDDVQSVAGVALVSAALRFDISRGVAFKTFLFHYLKGHLSKEIAKRIKHTQTIRRVEETASTSGYGESELSWCFDRLTAGPEVEALTRDSKNQVNRAFKRLTKIEQRVIWDTFVNELSVSEIAVELGYCRCHLSRVKTKAMKRLSLFMQRANLDSDRNLAGTA